MKKLLFVIPTLGGGGAERSLVNLLNELPADEFDIDLLLFKNTGIFLGQVPSNVKILEQTPALKGLYAPIKEAGVYLPRKVIGNACSRVFEKGMSAQKAFLWRHFYCKKIERLEKEYDVAIGYLGGESTDYVLDKVNAKKKIHWVHNDYRKLGMSKKYDIDVFRRVDAVVTISDECLNILEEEFPQYTDKLYCIPNITSSKVIRKRAEEFFPKEYEGISNILLSVGRLSEQKGFDLAISAAKTMKSNGLDFKWFIIGEGALRSKLEEQIKKDGVADRIILLGLRENPYPYIKNCDVFVQPSRFEGKSVVLDEAKILAKPIVATAYPTVRDQITSGNEGIIAELSAIGLAQVLEHILKNEELLIPIQNYLKSHEYGNSVEIKKYIALLGGEET